MILQMPSKVAFGTVSGNLPDYANDHLEDNDESIPNHLSVSQRRPPAVCHNNGHSAVSLFSVTNIPDMMAKTLMRGYRKRDAHLRRVEERIKNQRMRRTGSKETEN